MKNEIKNKEKEFLKNLKNLKIDKKYGIKKLDNLLMKIEIANKKINFYEKYKDISNDFYLEYEINSILSKKLSVILELEKDSINKIKEYTEELNKVDKTDNSFKEEFKKFKTNQLEEFNYHKELLKNKLKKGLISSKAYKNEILNRKIKLNKRLEFKKLEEKTLNLKNKIAVTKNQTKLEVKTKYEEINIEISDIKNKVELDEKNTVSKYLAFYTFLIPGLGQFILKEKLKSLLYFIGTLYTFFVALPYSLGYGNYRGTGLSGLITLAYGGKRLDRSLIFMIEGIVAIILVFIAILIYYFSFKDVFNTTKKINSGKRVLNFYETKKKVLEDGFPYIVSNISGLLILFIVIVPIITTIFLSFTNMDPDNQSKFNWVGISNYMLLIKGQGIAGGPFWNILIWTIIWTFFATSSAIFVGFGLSLIAHNERIKGKKIIRTIYLLPWAVPAFITIMFFSIMTSNNGVLTQILEKLTGHYIPIKESTLYTRIFLIFLQTWLGSSYVFLLSTGVLQGIPSDLYEAADIDGANVFQKLRKIIIPLVLMQTAPLLIGQYTFNFNNFSIIYLFNNGGPFNPIKYGNIAGSTDLLISYIYKLTIQKNYQAVGSAITIFISLGLILITYIGFKNTKAFKEEN